MRRVDGLASIAGDYDGFIIDLWGVIHDGVRPYPGALECLRALAGRPVLLLSNAPRRAWSAARMLQRMDIAPEAYSALLTSGEATWLALRDRSDSWFARLGPKVYHLGPMRDRNVIEGLPLSIANAPADADFVLNTGPDDERDGASLDVFIPELQACRAAGLPMICANPDLAVVRDGARILCAGALAQYYASVGGDVRSIGKPDAAIYRMALGQLQLAPSRVLAIGDSLRTDIAGAACAGLDALWILDGIHSQELAASSEGAEALAASYGLFPFGAQNRLAWRS